MDETWIVSVEGRPYGPYPFEQMRTFIAEGRVIAQSLVSHPGSDSVMAAGDDSLLGPLFRPASPGPAAVTQILPPPEPIVAPIVAPIIEPVTGRDAAPRFGREDGASEPGHILIVADMKSRSVNGLEEAIFNLGQAFPLLPQVWLLSTDKSVNAVRNTLVQKLGKLDMLFVVDATHDKSAWYNFGPETESRIRRIWAKASDADRKAG